MLEFLSARSERQREAYDGIRAALEAYDVECIDTLIGDILPPAELMKTQTDRKIADELQRTYDVQREAQVKRQQLERETAVANMQARGGAQRADGAHQREERAGGRPRRPRARRRGCARGRGRGRRDAAAGRGAGRGHAAPGRGGGRGDPRRRGRRRRRRTARAWRRWAPTAFTAMQLAAILGEHGVKLVPDIAVGGSGTSSIAGALLARVLRDGKAHDASAVAA